MKIAIMQPYFFPYMGYFELMASVDLFVFLEDVQFTRKGWVNRNRIIDQHHDFQYLTIPIRRCSRSTKINEVFCCPHWKQSILDKVIKTYGKRLHSSIIECLPSANITKLVDTLKHSLIKMCDILEIDCNFASSKGISKKSGQEKILEICRFFGAQEYWNLSGGIGLYNQENFSEIKLNFMRPTSFANKLSIIDSISNSEIVVKQHLKKIFKQSQS